MATDTLTTLANIFKTKYEPEFTKAFNEEYVGFQIATKKSRKFSGGSEIFGIQATRANGVGFRGETQALPTPGGPQPLQASVPLRRLFKVFEISHDAIKRSEGDDAAYRETLGWEIETGFDRLKKVANISLYGDGKGVLATVATAGGATLTSTIGNEQTITVDTTRYLSIGDLVAFWTSAATATLLANGGQENAGSPLANDESVQVSAIVNTTQCKVKRLKTSAGSASIVAGNLIRLYGDSTTDGSTRTDNALSGLALFADDSTASTSFEGIDRTVNTMCKGQIIDLANANMTRNDIYRLNDKIRRNSSAIADTLLWDLSLRREYLNIVQPDVRFAPVKDLDAGYDNEALAMSVGSKKWTLYEDVDVPFGTVFAFPKSVFYWMELSPMELDASTGSVLRQALPYGAVSGVGDVFYGYARCKGNFATDLLSGFGKLINVAYTLE